MLETEEITPDEYQDFDPDADEESCSQNEINAIADADEPYAFGECIDCGAELQPYEDELCLKCEDKRNREHGIDDFLT